MTTYQKEKMSNSIVQYVLLRSDLLKELGWSIGALVAQACHASTAVLHLYREDENTIKYLNDLDNMHKVVLEVNIFSILCSEMLIATMHNNAH